jgi:hypothetical protein
MSWRAAILESFDPRLAPLLIVADPDGLLRDPSINLELTGRGYTLLPYDDPIAFRLAYEAALNQPLVVVLWDRARAVETLPADVLRRGLLRRLGLAELFPRLHIPILIELSTEDLDRLWPVYGQQRSSILSANATVEAVLQLCFGITPTAIQTSADALALLLQIHFAPRPLPPRLAEALLLRLRRLDALAEWPLDELLRDRAAFDAFLAQAWPRFLHESGLLQAPASEQSRVEELRAQYAAAPMLPFGDARVWPGIDTLFLAGRLTPATLPTHWIVTGPYTVGIHHERADQGEERGRKLVELMRAQGLTAESLASDWLRHALLIGEMMALQHEYDQDLALADTTHRLRAAFAEWMLTRYKALQSAAPLPAPQLVSHLAYAMAQRRDRGHRRQALIVIDSMALDQWVAIRQVWREQDAELVWDERALFAWVPTLTHVSRQAIFAGAAPTQFAASLGRTDAEEAHWKRFWSGYGLQPGAVGYLKGLHGLDPQRSGAELDRVAELIATPSIQVVGLVVDAVDQIAHGMLQGEAGMLQQVRQWASSGWLGALVARLRAENFSIMISADHGNVAVRGIGRVDDGILAEERGLRARVYADVLLRDRVAAGIPASLSWQGAGLPPSYAVLLAPPGSVFTTEGQFVVTHGGADLREVLVPWCILRE